MPRVTLRRDWCTAEQVRARMAAVKERPPMSINQSNLSSTGFDYVVTVTQDSCRSPAIAAVNAQSKASDRVGLSANLLFDLGGSSRR